MLLEPLSVHSHDGAELIRASVADLAVECELAINQLKVRDWTSSLDVVNQMKTALEDCLYEFDTTHGLKLTSGELDTLIESIVGHEKPRLSQLMTILGGQHKLQYGTSAIDYELTYSQRKTIGIRVYPDSTVVVDAPIGTSLPQVNRKSLSAAGSCANSANFRAIHQHNLYLVVM